MTPFEMLGLFNLMTTVADDMEKKEAAKDGKTDEESDENNPKVKPRGDVFCS